MEEKERFELFGKHCIKDNNPDARRQLLDAYVACVILNEQDKRIKELNTKLVEEMELSAERRQIIEDLTIENNQQDKEIKKIKKELSKYGSYKTTDERIRDLENLYSDYKNENQQLKKQLEETKQAASYQVMLMCQKENILLKQGQKQLAINKMTELYNLTDEIYHSNDMDKEWLLDWLKAEIWKLNQEIKSLKGEE